MSKSTQETHDIAPRFGPGCNLAMKVPEPLYEETVAFYRDVVALPLLESCAENTVFAFGAMKLHLDRCPQMSQAELWMQLTCNDNTAAAKRLSAAGVRRCDAIEPLPEGFNGFWISNPAGIVHLIDGDAPAAD